MLTVTSPKLKLPGTTVKSSVLAEETPFPLKATTAGEFAAVLLIIKLPLAAPDALGVKVTLTVMLWPAVNVVGRVLPADENGPDRAMPFTVIDSAPLFEINTPCAALEVLIGTDPRFKVDGFTVRLRLAEDCASFEPTIALQPASPTNRTACATKQIAALDLLLWPWFSLTRAIRRKAASTSS